MSASKRTAAELIAELGKNPGFVKQQEEREQQRLREVDELRVAAAPLLKELEELGFKVSAVAELPQKKLSYEKAIPTLLKWLPCGAHPKLKEGIVRALSVPFAKPKAAPVLIEEFRRASTGQQALKWAIGNALEVIADDAVFDDVVSLVRDRTHGKAREMLAVSLGNMSDPRAIDVLLELLKDEDVAGHAIMDLGKLGPSRSRAAIERFLADPKAWVRKEAKKAIDKIDKSRRA